jgi:hypothetical protein
VRAAGGKQQRVVELLYHGIDKERPDCTVYCGEWAIGRIYETRGGPDHLRWFWSLMSLAARTPTCRASTVVAWPLAAT